MYDYLRGKLAYADLRTAVVDCGGVGYRCSISENTYQSIFAQNEVKLYTHLSVREDAMELYGFADEDEREAFLLLIGISGVGPKAALAVLSVLTSNELGAAVEKGDHKAVSRANGIGPKIAQRICLELKGKLAFSPDVLNRPEETQPLFLPNEKDDAVEILVSLGYIRNDAKHAVDRCSADNAQDLVKQALRLLNTMR